MPSPNLQWAMSPKLSDQKVIQDNSQNNATFFYNMALNIVKENSIMISNTHYTKINISEL